MNASEAALLCAASADRSPANLQHLLLNAQILQADYRQAVWDLSDAFGREIDPEEDLSILTVSRLVNHAADSDCTVDPETRCCSVCGVLHDAPCLFCGGRAFHSRGCPVTHELYHVEPDCCG